MKIEMLGMVEACGILTLLSLLVIACLVGWLGFLLGRDAEGKRLLEETRKLEAKHEEALKAASAASLAELERRIAEEKSRHDSSLAAATQSHLAQIDSINKGHEAMIGAYQEGKVSELELLRRELGAVHADDLRKAEEKFACKLTESNAELDARHAEALKAAIAKAHTEALGKPVKMEDLSEERYEVTWWEQANNRSYLALFKSLTTDEVVYVDCGVPVDGFPAEVPFIIERRDRWYNRVTETPAPAPAAHQKGAGTEGQS